MGINRRDFLKLSGAGLGGLFLLGAFGDDAVLARTLKKKPLAQSIQEVPTICCYCSVGCGAIVSVYADGTLKIEGDPDHPISQGALCSKGQAMAQVRQVDGELNPYRLTKPLYRAPYSTEWEEKTWDWMIDTIATRAKATRDASFVTSAGRTDGLASFGGGELDNEECYLLAKMNRALGVVYLEHCARI
jgi:formate dehydrogenase major subunit